MLNVSQAFLDAIKAPRRQVIGRVIVEYSDPFVDPSLSVEANETAYISHPEQVTNGLIEPTHKWASLDGSWVLDGSFYLSPDTSSLALNNELGWWGDSLSDEDGMFSTPYPKISIFFSGRPVRWYKVAGDDARGEYPVDFTIRLYGESNNLLKEETVIDNNNLTWSKDIDQISGVAKMSLEISRWSHAGKQVKITEFYSSLKEVYEGNDIISLQITEEREISNGSLPIGNITANEIDLKLYNRNRRFDADNVLSPIYGVVRPNRRIEAFLGVRLPGGGVEYAPLGTFWCGDWDAPENDIYAATTGLDKLEILRNKIYSSSYVLENANLYDLAVNILTDAGLANSEYWIDPDLENYVVPYAWFDQKSHREALRILAEACGGQCYMSRDNILRIEGPAFLQTERTVSQLTITGNDYFALSNPAVYSEIANYIQANTQPLASVGESQQVYKSDSPVSINVDESKTMTIFFNANPVINASVGISDYPAGTSISNITCYAWGATFTVEAGDVGGTFSVEANGYPLSVQGSQLVLSFDENSIKNNGQLKYQFSDNPLIQSVEMGKRLTDAVLELSKDPRNNLDMSQWRGNPALELGDRITVPSRRGSSSDYWVTAQTLEWTGTLQATLKGKKVSDLNQIYAIWDVSDYDSEAEWG